MARRQNCTRVCRASVLNRRAGSPDAAGVAMSVATLILTRLNFHRRESSQIAHPIPNLVHSVLCRMH
ncbi:hypothetical protein PANT111_100085 [Pantoea brenneri]|uniref:Uncharacterized protein n=1 Tax=Pantoea brenneri TaxID=472694 RepID=A0AAX3J0F7_9GAMM|nr:hypothetical protein PANT111_100085 [Pantoea brenneri]